MQADPTPKPGERSALRRHLPWFSLVLLGWVLSRFPLAQVGEAFSRASLASVLETATLFGVNLALKSLRWQRMLQVQGLRLPGRVAVAAFFSSQFYGQVTLGRLGELYRAEALTERGVPVGTALSSSVYDRLLDVMAVLLLGAALSALVLADLRAAIAAFASTLLVCLLGLAVLRAPGLAALAPVARLRAFLAARRGTRGLLGMLAQLVAGLGPLLAPGFLFEALLWTAAAWGLYFASLVRLAAGMDVHAGPSPLIAAGALGALSALLPVTISGLGARELIFMRVLALCRVPGPLAVVLSFLHLAIMSAVSIGLGLLGMLARQRQQRAGAG